MIMRIGIVLGLLSPAIVVDASGPAEPVPLREDNNWQVVAAATPSAFPDVAYSRDSTVDRYLIVWESEYIDSSGKKHGNILGLFRNPAGGNATAFSIERSSEDARRPKVAWGSGNTFLVVWKNKVNAASLWTVQGALVVYDAARPYAPTITRVSVADALNAGCEGPDVGYLAGIQTFVLVVEYNTGTTSALRVLGIPIGSATDKTTWVTQWVVQDGEFNQGASIASRSQDHLALAWTKGSTQKEVWGASISITGSAVTRSAPQLISDAIDGKVDQAAHFCGDSEETSFVVWSCGGEYRTRRAVPGVTGLTYRGVVLTVHGDASLQDVCGAASLLDGKEYLAVAYGDSGDNDVHVTTYGTNMDPPDDLESLDVNGPYVERQPAVAIDPSRKQAVVCFQAGAYIYGRTVDLVPLDVDPPTPPSGLSAQATAQGELTLTWTSSSDDTAVAGYLVQRNSDAIEMVVDTLYVDEGLVPNTGYTYSVRAVDYADKRSAAVIVTTMTLSPPDTTPPTAPTNLKAASAGNTTLLTWTAASDNIAVATYRILRQSSGEQWGEVGTYNLTSWKDSGLQAGATYSYKVAAVDDAKNVGPFSNEVTVTLPPSPDVTPPSAPGSLVASAKSETRIDLSWQASSDEGEGGLSGYRIERSADGKNFTPLAMTTTLQHSDTSLSPGTVYWYRVLAVDTAGNRSAPSATVSVITPRSETPQAPSGDSGGGGGCGLVGLEAILLLGLLACRRSK